MGSVFKRKKWIKYSNFFTRCQRRLKPRAQEWVLLYVKRSWKCMEDLLRLKGNGQRELLSNVIFHCRSYQDSSPDFSRAYKMQVTCIDWMILFSRTSFFNSSTEYNSTTISSLLSNFCSLTFFPPLARNICIQFVFVDGFADIFPSDS